MPSKSNRDQFAAELGGLKERLEEWRASAPRGRRRIPADIWEEATRLALRHGTSKVSIPLRLDYATLKSRVEALSPKRGKAPSLPMVRRGAPNKIAVTEFVELLGTPCPKARLAPCVLQIESSRGSRLRVEVGGLDASGLALLLREFA